MNQEQRIAGCKASVSRIYAMLHSSPERWQEYIVLARSIVAQLNSTTLMRDPGRTEEQVWIINALQRLAFADADHGSVIEIASWCLQQWLAMLQREPQNIAALHGVGQIWLSRSQPTLARIHRSESSSSSGSGSRLSATSLSPSEEERQHAAATAAAERSAGTADYVEARALLQPATEYLERAVAASTAHRRSAEHGDLLAQAAEAYMSLGNSSSPRTNERYFTRAIELLRAAASVPGYRLKRHLQRCLDDYGRYVR